MNSMLRNKIRDGLVWIYLVLFVAVVVGVVVGLYAVIADGDMRPFDFTFKVAIALFSTQVVLFLFERLTKPKIKMNDYSRFQCVECGTAFETKNVHVNIYHDGCRGMRGSDD